MSISGPVAVLRLVGSDAVRGAVERLPDAFYLRETDLVLTSAPLREFADTVAADGDRTTLPLLHRLLGAVYERIAFEAGPASAALDAARAFEAGAGVCQDLAHVFIAAARHLEIPSRYVSGYFRRDDGGDRAEHRRDAHEADDRGDQALAGALLGRHGLQLGGSIRSHG